jgi:hypothetical protein
MMAWTIVTSDSQDEYVVSKLELGRERTEFMRFNFLYIFERKPVFLDFQSFAAEIMDRARYPLLRIDRF